MAFLEWRVWAAERQAQGQPITEPTPLDPVGTITAVKHIFDPLAKG